MKKEEVNISVIGLGYVGLPLALELSKRYNVIGFDLDEVRISELNDKHDRTNELSSQDLLDLGNFEKTSNENAIAKSNFYIINTRIRT